MKKIFVLLMTFVFILNMLHAKEEDGDDENEKRFQSEETGEDSDKAKNLFNLSEQDILANHIHTSEIGRGSAYVTTRVPGRIEFDANNTAEVHSPLEGQLLEWKVAIGDQVKKGDVLGSLDSPQNLSGPIIFKSLIDGEIVERNPGVGAWVQPADKLAVITNMSFMCAVAEVREDLVDRIMTDIPVTIRVLAFPDETFQGHFLSKSASVEPETRTVKFRFSVSNTARKLRSGMFAYFSLAIDQVKDKLFVPEEAVQIVHNHPVVFVEENKGQYRMAPVQLGHKTGEMIEVSDGLKGGEKVVSMGSFVLKSEALRSELVMDDD